MRRELATQAVPAVTAVDRANRSRLLAAIAAQVAHDNRGQDVAVLDMRELTPVFDFFVLATGTSRRQLHAIAEDIDATLKKQYGERRLSIEGYESSNWILLDYGDMVVHLFDAEARDYYALEQLWSGAGKLDWETVAGPRIAKTEE